MSMICMNEACKATTTFDWKRGWELKSGGNATLCYSCGSIYESSLYCETFHLEQSGWRECKFCSKNVHCGCIVSKNLHEYLDLGGVGCISCLQNSENQPPRLTKVANGDTSNGFGLCTANNIRDANGIDGLKFDYDKGRIVKINNVMTETGTLGEQLDEEVGAARGFTDLLQQCVGPSMLAKEDSARPELEGKSSSSLPNSAFRFSPGPPSRLLHNFGKKELNKVPTFQQGKKSGQNLTKHSKTDSESNKGMATGGARIARPPADGRGRNQLLPRYWPRMTDQEVQQISGDLNSTIVPLFEKVLSASDAGRIGRLVLPKACAEAYFPHISQSDGIPVKVQDIKGNEWKFQFRFWPNNNSRMYVLEGVTPCIQNMNLQAGDTVTFSRIDPGEKLVIGYRRSSNSGDVQDYQPSARVNGTGSGESSLPGVDENHPKKVGGETNENTPHQCNLAPGKKKSRNIGSKNKRFHMHDEDAMELKLTWDEAQDLLRVPPSVKPNIVMIEDQAFEEYEEPPIFGKVTIFTEGESGNQEQWAQCDSCYKWRRLPADVLVPPKWTCSDNIWDPRRCSCSASGETTCAEMESFLRDGKDFKKRKVVESSKTEQEHDASGLVALATAAFMGETNQCPGESSMGATTRHPRHRPGCTCIVCSQPPSGKGHESTCICNVCLTVKRRFKTLMLNKNKRKEELALEKEKPKHVSETNGTAGNGSLFKNENKASAWDLNCDPNREEVIVEERPGFGMYQGQNGTTKLRMHGFASPEEECISYTAGEGANDEMKDQQGN